MIIQKFIVILLLVFVCLGCDTKQSENQELDQETVNKELATYYFDIPDQTIKLDLKPIELLSGVRRSSKEMSDQLILLNFWATWCTPCVHEMPAMEKFRQETRDNNIQLIAINFGQKRPEIKKFLKLHPEWKFEIAVDPQHQMGRSFNIQGLPTTILISRSGKLLGKAVGPIRWDKPEFIRFMKQLSVNKGV